MTRQFCTRNTGILLAGVLCALALNIGSGPYSGSFFVRLESYIRPQPVVLPAFEVLTVAADDESLTRGPTDPGRVVFTLRPTKSRLIDSELIRAAIDVCQIEVWAQPIGSADARRIARVQADSSYIPGPPAAAQNRGGRLVDAQAQFTLAIDTEIDLPPGAYEVWAVVFADPPYGGGANGEHATPPACHWSTSVDRPWFYTSVTEPIRLVVSGDST